MLCCASIFEPSRMLVLPTEKLHEKVKVFLRYFIGLGIISPQKSFVAEDLSNMLQYF